MRLRVVVAQGQTAARIEGDRRQAEEAGEAANPTRKDIESTHGQDI
jgi:hypothetical protein